LELAQILIGGIGPGLKFFQTVGEKLGFETCSNLNWGNQTQSGNLPNGWGKIGIWNLLKSQLGESNPVRKFFQIVEEKFRFGTCSNLNWGNRTWSGILRNGWGKIGIWSLLKSQLGESNPVCKFFKTVREKLRFGTCSNLNWGNRTLFRNLPNGQGKIGIWNLLKSQLGELDPVWKFFQTVGEKLGFGICSNLNWGNWTRSGIFPNSWGMGFGTYSNLNWGNRTRSGILPNGRGKIGIWNLLKSQLGESDPVWKFFQTIEEKLGFGICSNLNWGNQTRSGIFPNGRGMGFGTYLNLNWGNRTRFGILPNGREKIRIWNLLKSQLGESDPV
jgi:hypothetical protein